ncbi:DUF4238 domain-containing protein [Bacillus cereus]|nr:DUF4238 domain-containing protein [Bacillus cereus]
MGTQAVYHHLVPQTYMKSWKHGKSSIYIVKKEEGGVGESKSTLKFGGINHYHSFSAGSLFRTEEDCDEFFKPLENYTVKIDGKVLDSTVDMNNLFYKFDAWSISKENGEVVNETEQKILKKEILSIHVRDIELGWDRKYENYWNSTNQLISYEIFSNIPAQLVVAAKKEDLIKFMVSMEWRTKPYHPVLRQSLETIMSESYSGIDFKAIDITEDERQYPFLKTWYDMFAHNYILKLYREFLDGKGKIMDEAREIIDNLCIVMYIAPSDGEFITSDNPVCRFTNEDGEVEYIFPINPKISCAVMKGRSLDSYPVKYLSKDGLVYYNNKLKDNSNEFYILREQDLTLYFVK